MFSMVWMQSGMSRQPRTALTLALRRQRSHVRIVSGAPPNLLLNKTKIRLSEATDSRSCLQNSHRIATRYVFGVAFTSSKRKALASRLATQMISYAGRPIRSIRSPRCIVEAHHGHVARAGGLVRSAATLLHGTSCSGRGKSSGVFAATSANLRHSTLAVEI